MDDKKREELIKIVIGWWVDARKQPTFSMLSKDEFIGCVTGSTYFMLEEIEGVDCRLIDVLECVRELYGSGKI